jgi:hypothetical protein
VRGAFLGPVPESVVPAACVQGAVDEARQSGRLRSLDARVGLGGTLESADGELAVRLPPAPG